MQENKSDYSKLKVVQTNFYSPNLYGQDVEDFHNGNSRVLMYRYVKLMRASKYILILCVSAVYFIGGFELGSILSKDFVIHLMSKCLMFKNLYVEIVKEGGGLLELSNLILIFSIIMPVCLLLSVILILAEMRFLIRFKFGRFISTLTKPYWRIVFEVLLLALVLYICVFYLPTTVGGNSTSRMAFLWRPIDGLLGYTIYSMACLSLIWFVPSVITSLYALLLKVKGEFK